MLGEQCKTLRQPVQNADCRIPKVSLTIGFIRLLSGFEGGNGIGLFQREWSDNFLDIEELVFELLKQILHCALKI
jgi:hypothetical protein